MPLAPRARGLLVCAAAYAAALAAALATGALGPWQHPLAVAAAADLVATLVVFAVSRATDNSSVYDPYWSVAPPALAVWFATQADGADPARVALTMALVFAWGARLTWNWARGWGGLGHEDWRYREIRARTGRLYWPVSLLGIHLMPTALTFGGSMALLPALTSPAPLGWLDLAGGLVAAGGILLEAVADEQLWRFTRAPARPRGATLATGLWARSRHPNYLGEMTFWWGLWLLAVAADPAWAWTVVGPLAITALFAGVSVPLMEARAAERRAGWAEHARRVPALVPRPWRPRRR